MNAALQLGVAGYFKFEAFKADADGNEIAGTRRTLGDWQKNLITNGGLDMLGVAASGNWLNGCHVGSGTTAPSNVDAALETFVAGIATNVSTTSGVGGAGPYYGYRRRVFRFAEGAFDSVNLTEVGIASGTEGASGTARLSGAALFSRALINGGTGITVLVDETLDVTYEIRNFAPTVDVTGTVTISGTDYDFTLRACNVTAANYWGNASSGVYAYGVTEGPGNIVSGNAYSGVIGAVTSEPSTSISSTSVNIASRADYTNGNYYRDVTWQWGLSDGSGDYRSFRLAMRGGSFQIELDPVMAKDGTKVVTLTLRVSWARV